MKLIWHIAKKDIYRLRLLLLLWVLLIGAQVFVCQRLIFSNNAVDQEWFSRGDMVLMLLMMVDVAACYLLVARMVFEDSLVGATMFWATRPISGGRLLCGKLLGIVLMFGLLPLLVWIPWWLICGYGWHELQIVALSNLKMHAVAVVAALALAALIGSGNRFALWTSVLPVAIPANFFVFTPKVVKSGEQVIAQGLIDTRAGLALWMLVVTAVAVALLQYCSRRVGRSIVVSVVGLGVAALIRYQWHWDFSTILPVSTEQAAGTEKIAVRFLAAQFTQPKKDELAGVAGITVNFLVTEIPPGMTVTSGEAGVEFRWSNGFKVKRRVELRTAGYDGSQVNSASRALGLPLPLTDPETQQKRDLMLSEQFGLQGADAGFSSHSGHCSVDGFIALTPSLATKTADETPACSVSLRLSLSRAVVVFELPIKEGEKVAKNGVLIRILKIETGQTSVPGGRSGQTLVTVALSQLASANPVQFHWLDRAEGREFYVELPASSNIWKRSMRFTREVISPVPSLLWRKDRWRWVEVPQNTESASLVGLTFPGDGGFNRQLETDKLVLLKANQ